MKTTKLKPVHHPKIVIDAKFNVLDRGMCLVMDFAKNKEVFLQAGDTMRWQRYKYEILSIENIRTSGKGYPVGLMVKLIK